MSFDPGDVWAPELTVKDAAGDLTAATVTLAVTSPSGVVSAPTVSTSSTGVYTATVPLDEPGRWVATWTVSGAVTGSQEDVVYVRRSGGTVVRLADVKALLDETSDDDDDELERMIDAAVAAYERRFGYRITGDVVEEHAAGCSEIWVNSSSAGALVSVAYEDGTEVDIADLSLSESGKLRWRYNTTGLFPLGLGLVIVTYKAGEIAADHREAIIHDAAGLFAATQRGSADLLGDGLEAAYNRSPIDLYPRIYALPKAPVFA